MKRMLGVVSLSILLLSGCSIFPQNSTSEPTMPEHSSNSSENDDSDLDESTESESSEIHEPTFIKRTDCAKDMKFCKEEKVTLHDDSTTSNGKKVDENLIDQYREAAFYSKLKDKKPKGTSYCGSIEIGVTLPEWDDRTVFFCEYDKGNEDTLKLVTEKVLEESGLLKNGVLK